MDIKNFTFSIIGTLNAVAPQQERNFGPKIEMWKLLQMAQRNTCIRESDKESTKK